MILNFVQPLAFNSFLPFIGKIGNGFLIIISLSLLRIIITIIIIVSKISITFILNCMVFYREHLAREHHNIHCTLCYLLSLHCCAKSFLFWSCLGIQYLCTGNYYLYLFCNNVFQQLCIIVVYID